MRNLIIVFISLFTFCIGISGQQKCKLNVGSFNLRYDNEGDKDDSWVHRKDMAVSLVHFHDFDVFGIQEGLIAPSEGFGERWYVYVCWCRPG